MLYLQILFVMILVVQNTQANDKKMSSKEQNSDLINSTNIFNSCIIISYNYLIQDDTQIENELNKIMEAYNNIIDDEERIKQQYIAQTRIKLEAVKHCIHYQTVQGAQKMLEELQNKKFDTQNYYHLMNGFELKKYYNREIQYKFTKDEATLIDMIEEFLSKLKQAQGIEDQSSNFNDLYPKLLNNDFQMKIFGISINSSWPSYIVLLSVAIVIILILKYAYSTLQEPLKKSSKRQKKSKN